MVGQNQIYDRAAEQYDRIYKKRKYRWRAKLIERRARAISRGSVLELGCGTGRLLLDIRGRADDVVGVDLSMPMLKHALFKGLDVVCADAQVLPFRSGSFDAIVGGKGVFRYLETAKALKECARVLKTGGIVAIHQYAERTWSLRSRQIVDTRHLDGCDELIGAAKKIGLELESKEFWRSIPFPPYALPIIGVFKGRWWSQAVIMFKKTGP